MILSPLRIGLNKHTFKISIGFYQDQPGQHPWVLFSFGYYYPFYEVINEKKFCVTFGRKIFYYNQKELIKKGQQKIAQRHSRVYKP